VGRGEDQTPRNAYNKFTTPFFTYGRRHSEDPGDERRIAESLARGNRTADVAKRFEISDCRISQLRASLRKVGGRSSAMSRQPRCRPSGTVAHGRPI